MSLFFKSPPSVVSTSGLGAISTADQRSGLHLLLALILLFAFSASRIAAQSAPTTTQQITLRAGWNLVAFQVGDASAPITAAAFRAALSTPAALEEIWAYDPSGDPARPGIWRTYQPALDPTLFTSDLTSLTPGRGYWVKISSAQSAVTLTLSGSVWSGALTLAPGWNLVGFGGLALAANETQDFASIFGSQFARIPQIWTFDAASQRFLGTDTTAIPALRTLTAATPGSAYWVYALETTTLTPVPFLALPADSDIAPLQPAELFSAAPTTPPRWLGTDPARYLGRAVRYRAADGSDNAYDLNGNGLLDDATTQDTILFEKTADTVSLTIGNTGGGILAWSLEISPDWLYTAPADPRTWPAGATTRPRAASGTVSSEKDTLLLYADRTGMSPGRRTGDMTIWVGGQAFPVDLLLDIAPVDGDWLGSATTTRVGGRNISLGEVRLALNTFSIGGDEANGFRSVLNREQSILFPRDVFMDGVFYAPNQFKLTTNFEMKAGDRNAPPYNTFPGDAKDRDFNGNGKVDVMNPFPYGIRREVTLLGTRTSPDRLEGTYIESIRGLLPPLSANTLATDQTQFVNDAFLTQSQPVFIEGTFVLERQSFAPTKRSVFNESADLQLGIGGSDPVQRPVTFTVGTPVTVQGVTLTLNIAYPDPALLRVSLISPQGTAHVVHDFGDASAVPSSVQIPVEVFAGENGAGEWTLLIEWDGASGERGSLASWGLNLEGVSTHQATGRIVAAGVPLPGATLRLEGGVTTQTFTSSSSGQLGSFTIPDLTENDYTLTISKPGYQTITYTFFVSETDAALGDIALAPLSITEPRLTAAPPIGYAGTLPLHVEFTVDLPLGFADANITWDFDGNGIADQSGPLATLTEVTHEYAIPGLYTATVTLSGGGLAGPIIKTQIIHVHRGLSDPAGSTTQILVTAFVGNFGARADIGAANPAAPPTEALEVTSFTVAWLGSPATPRSLISGYVPQESKWDSATFDIDRSDAKPLPPPLVSIPATNTFNFNAEDSDFGARTYVSGASVDGPAYLAFKTTSTNPYKFDLRAALGTDPGYDKTPGVYQIYTVPAGLAKPNRFRIATALGGAVFSPTPAVVGDLRIQPGRTLP